MVVNIKNNRTENRLRQETEIMQSSINQYNEGKIKFDELVERMIKYTATIIRVMQWK